MRDPQTGAGGLSLGIVILLTTGLGIASIQRSSVLPALIVSESAAKFSMVSDAWIGKSAHKGMNTSFVNAMHGARRNLKILSSFILMVCVSVPLLGLVGLIAALVAVLVSTVIVAIADRNFGGITGDVMGATNEITRLFTILTILGAAHWA
jgi:adenosylcobinamide-GDP ribazoletransferase